MDTSLKSGLRENPTLFSLSASVADIVGHAGELKQRGVRQMTDDITFRYSVHLKLEHSQFSVIYHSCSLYSSLNAVDAVGWEIKLKHCPSDL